MGSEGSRAPQSGTPRGQAGGERERGGVPRPGPRQLPRGSARGVGGGGAAVAGPDSWRLSETVTLASGAGPAWRPELNFRPFSCRPTADGPALPLVREHGPGRQVGPRSGRRVGRKAPQRRGSGGLQGPQGPRNQRKGARGSTSAPGTPGAGLCGKVRARLQDQKDFLGTGPDCSVTPRRSWGSPSLMNRSACQDTDCG